MKVMSFNPKKNFLRRKNKMTTKRKNRGFTLIELLVVFKSFR